MHRSRLAAIGIDCPSESALDTASFWRAALEPGTAPPSVFESGDPYLTVGSAGGREVFVQAIEGPARVHLDIETDDVEAEVARLEAHGATRVRQVETWWIMHDPSGHPFCVVRPQTDDFPGDAAIWR
ncbi:MAG: hypothetical protein JWO77_3271 [Ilumatobacteraceae bacterium]|nr:hypothetical protein [Ilumatobacteraceae bacterium]